MYIYLFIYYLSYYYFINISQVLIKKMLKNVMKVKKKKQIQRLDDTAPLGKN